MLIALVILQGKIMEKVIISVLAQDRPGILAAISRKLFMKNCNIENVSQTSLQSEFAGIFIVSKPKTLSTEALQSYLDNALLEMVQNENLDLRTVTLGINMDAVLLMGKIPESRTCQYRRSGYDGRPGVAQ